LLVLFLLTVSSHAQSDATPSVSAAKVEGNRLTIEHLLQLAEVSDPQISPEGDWIAYTVSRDDAEEDESRSCIGMAPGRSVDALPIPADD